MTVARVGAVFENAVSLRGGRSTRRTYPSRMPPGWVIQQALPEKASGAARGRRRLIPGEQRAALGACTTLRLFQRGSGRRLPRSAERTKAAVSPPKEVSFSKTAVSLTHTNTHTHTHTHFLSAWCSYLWAARVSDMARESLRSTSGAPCIRAILIRSPFMYSSFALTVPGGRFLSVHQAFGSTHDHKTRSRPHDRGNATEKKRRHFENAQKRRAKGEKGQSERGCR